jgi:hypothetical protein
MCEAHLVAVDMERPVRGLRLTREDAEELVLALALEGHEAQDLPWVEVEGDALEPRARAQLMQGQAWV